MAPDVQERKRPVEVVTNPCSGRYEGGDGVDVVLKVDIDQISEYSKSLGFVSGTITTSENAPWSVEASSLYFKIIPATSEIGGNGDLHELKASAKLFYSDGTRHSGSLHLKITLDESKKWTADLEIESADEDAMVFEKLEKGSKYFENVGIDIDYTEKVTWPVVEVKNLSNPPADMLNRKIDPCQAFADAGIKLIYDESQSEKLEDPTPETPWTKSDLYDAMMAYYDEAGKDENIWCMMGTKPPDKRYMGFSFDKDGRHGFGLFTGHRSFAGLESDDPKKKADASRRFLHYLVHECGHCLGLKHPFEIGAPESLSWMNYAWKYDVGRDAGSFYRSFRFNFSDEELVVLRHSPEKAFRALCEPPYLNEIMGSGYKARSEAPDSEGHDEDNDDDDAESTNTLPTRKIGLELKVRNEYLKGQLLSFEAKLTNQGKLPALIEKDLSLESGNLQVYVTKPDGSSEVIEPFVRPVHSGYNKPHVLYTSADEEGPDYYNELVTVGRGSHGYQINEPGNYEIRAVYSGGRYTASSGTYTIEVIDDEDDEGAADDVLTAATLHTSNQSRFQDAFAYWNKLESETMKQKRAKISTLIALFKGLAQDSGREAAQGKALSGRKATFFKPKTTADKLQILKDTQEIVQQYHEEGTAFDNLEYATVVLARGEVYVSANEPGEGDKEFNELLNDLVERGESYEVISKLSKKWNKVKNPTPQEKKRTPQSLQDRIRKVLTWYPTTYGNGESELSGIGLGVPFGSFDKEHVMKAARIIEMLFTKYDETQDLIATINYADKLQKGREVNNMVLRWALEAFIVHSDDAKNAGIRYPEPELRDQSFETDAALIATRRDGEPSEDWMNYWRCDADFNYHHRHWHLVYVIGEYLKTHKKHLERQGELFGYMHSQMLARYDAERESWGLSPVKAWGYRDYAPGFNAGLEFHESGENREFVPRPNVRWPYYDVAKFSRWEQEYENAVVAGEVARGVEMNPNWSGHVLEPSSYYYERRFGSFHNTGHITFATVGIREGLTSYMSIPATAVRDPIFFRWHKKVDDLWQSNNEYYRSDLNKQPPPVTITADDILLSTDRNPPTGFTDWSDGNWSGRAPSEEAVLKTYLGPPKKKYEWDNKLSHEKFYYHLRLKRNPGTSTSDDIPLTIRIFICPRKRISERKRWIEMDKFVCNIASGSEHAEITRADVHSSVIKRLHRDLEGDEPDEEKRFVRTLGGFCECGWPYDMLLPRGTAEGEDYVISVIATDNRVDSIGIRTTCGSMSYCGASGQRYPDARNMGYPFCNLITYDNKRVGIPEVFDMITNAAYKSFKIQNDYAEIPRLKAIDVWWPYRQLYVDDGTSGDYKRRATEYIRSNLVGAFRVLVDNDATAPALARRILVRFQGRGAGGKAYLMRDVHLALRRRNTLDVVRGTSQKVLVNGQTSFSVPECGLISDAFEYRFDPARGDYFLTFTLDEPGVLLPSNRARQTSTYHISADMGDSDVSGDWSRFSRVYKRYSSIQCVSGIMTEM